MFRTLGFQIAEALHSHLTMSIHIWLIFQKSCMQRMLVQSGIQFGVDPAVTSIPVQFHSIKCYSPGFKFKVASLNIYLCLKKEYLCVNMSLLLTYTHRVIDHIHGTNCLYFFPDCKFNRSILENFEHDWVQYQF